MKDYGFCKVSTISPIWISNNVKQDALLVRYNIYINDRTLFLLFGETGQRVVITMIRIGPSFALTRYLRHNRQDLVSSK